MDIREYDYCLSLLFDTYRMQDNKYYWRKNLIQSAVARSSSLWENSLVLESLNSLNGLTIPDVIVIDKILNAARGCLFRAHWFLNTKIEACRHIEFEPGGSGGCLVITAIRESVGRMFIRCWDEYKTLYFSFYGEQCADFEFYNKFVQALEKSLPCIAIPIEQRIKSDTENDNE